MIACDDVPRWAACGRTLLVRGSIETAMLYPILRAFAPEPLAIPVDRDQVILLVVVMHSPRIPHRGEL